MLWKEGARKEGEGRGVGLGSCYGQESTDQKQLGLCPRAGHYVLFQRASHFSLEPCTLLSDWHAEMLSENQVFVIKGDQRGCDTVENVRGDDGNPQNWG